MLEDGEEVVAGQIIGYSGVSGVGSTYGPHLHFEISSSQNNGIPRYRINPAYFFHYKNHNELTNEEKMFNIMLHEYCIGSKMRHLIFFLCFIFCIYAQGSHALQWQSMDCKESDDLLIRLYGFIPACMDKDCKISLCQVGLQNARKVFINSSDISDAYKQWYQQDGVMSQMLGNMPLANTTIALYKNIITPYIRYTWKDYKILIIEEEYECGEVDNTYPIGRYIIFQQIRDKVLIIEIYNQVC